jgi:hypothetical protein
MKAALLTLVAVLAGLGVALVLVVAVELVSAVVHPVPTDFGGTMEEMCEHVKRIPVWVLALVVPAWGSAAFASAWTAQRIGNVGSWAIVGSLLLAALVFNISSLPYPMWFKIANLLVIPVAMDVGRRLSIHRKTVDLSEANKGA